MKYLWNLFLSLKEIFIVMFLQYAILFLCLFTIGVDKSVIYGSILLMIFQVCYIIWKSSRDKEIWKTLFCIKNYFPYVLLGIGVAASYNMIIFRLGLGQEVNTDIPIILNILCSGIIGPIFEEFLFRYDFIRRLEKFNNNKMMIIILSGVVFGLLHTGTITVIYATIVGIINSYIYMKDKDIIKPIIMHMSGNILVSFLTCYNFVTLLLGVFLIIISYFIIRCSREN